MARQREPAAERTFHALVRQLADCYNRESQELDALRIENAALRHRVHHFEEHDRESVNHTRRRSTDGGVPGLESGSPRAATRRIAGRKSWADPEDFSSSGRIKLPLPAIPDRDSVNMDSDQSTDRQDVSGRRNITSCELPGAVQQAQHHAASAADLQGPREAACVNSEEDSPKTSTSTLTGVKRSEISAGLGMCSWAIGVEMKHPPAKTWTEKQDGRQIELAANRTRSSMSRELSRETTDAKLSWYDFRLQHWMSNPASPRRLLWDIVGTLLIFYDLIVLPLQVCFQLDDITFTIFVDWLTLLYWTLNMPMSCMVGFSSSGELVMNPTRIRDNYLRAWFWLDLAVVVPDWVFSLVSLAEQSTKDQNGETVKLLRILRLTRIVRLLRLLKLRKIFKNFDDLLSTEYTSILSNVAKMILLMLAINHFVACIWFLIADNQQNTPTWLTEQNFSDKNWYYQYATALHWSLTQFMPASMDVQPHNLVERSYTVIVVIFGLVGFSFQLGIITGSLSQLRQLAQEESRQFWDLRRFLKSNKVPVRLSLRIQKYLEHAWHFQSKTREVKRIKILGLLSEQLLSELQYELNVVHFNVHPLFKRLCEDCNETMQRLSKTAVSTKHLARDDFLFLPGENATHMYIVVDGRLNYSRYLSKDQQTMEWVEYNEDWIAEPILWTLNWVHLGTLAAVKESVLLLVDPNEFRSKMSLNPHAFWLGRRYAEKFLIWLNDQKPEQLSDITQGEDMSEMLTGFIPERGEAFCQAQSSVTTREGSSTSLSHGSVSGERKNSILGYLSYRRMSA